MRLAGFFVMCGIVFMMFVGTVAGEGSEVTEGVLRAVNEDGEEMGLFPLKHTNVEAEISGMVARVVVTQKFTNPYKERLEAVYVFPLPENAAVDDMLMTVGDRTIRGLVKKREEARKIYDDAKKAGHVAALLDQERPNIFTQSVANIVPGDDVTVKIRYVEVLKYDDGLYGFVFPMVVGPRYIPGAPNGTPSSGGWAPNTGLVSDASRITPPVLKPEERCGHDISVSVKLDAGVPVSGITSPSHKIDVRRIDRSKANVKLQPGDTIPNKDFILRYGVAGERMESAVITHASDTGNYFLMMVQPKARYDPSEITPRELVFVMDCSGSMSGAPIEKAKEAVKRCLKELHPGDSFQVIRFSESASALSGKPLPNTPANVKKAVSYIEGLRGGGGTRMIEGIKAALDYPCDPGRMRIVLFMTDGYIGNEREILAAIRDKLGDSRLFSFGVGSSVNRYLLDRMAEVGRGTVQYVRPDEDTEDAVSRFCERIANPCLTDIAIDWKGLDVIDVFPARIPDLFKSQPLFIVGKFGKAGEATIEFSGKVRCEETVTRVRVNLPEREDANASLASLWARRKVRELESRQYGWEDRDIVREITEIGLEHRLMTRYTSFVAVEESFKVDTDGTIRKVVVPVPMPEYVSYEGVFGGDCDSFVPCAGVKARRFLAETACFMTGGSRHVMKKEEQRIGRPAHVAGELVSGLVEVTLKSSNEVMEVDSNGRVWRTGSSGERRLVRKLEEKSRKELRRLAGRLNMDKLNGKSFGAGSGAPKELTVIISGKKLTLTFHTVNDDGLPQEVAAIIRLIS